MVKVWEPARQPDETDAMLGRMGVKHPALAGEIRRARRLRQWSRHLETLVRLLQGEEEERARTWRSGRAGGRSGFGVIRP